MFERFSGIFKPRERKENLEKEQTKYLPNFDVLVISGFAGTGKTSAADEINAAIIGTQFVKIGQNFRSEYDDLNAIPVEKDIEIDREQERLILKTRHSFPLILESRLGGVLASDITTRFHKSPVIVTVLTTADEKVRYERLVKRKQEENPELSAGEIINDELVRDREFVAKMQTLYPSLVRGQHPFDPKVTNLDGLPVYDFVVDTTNIAKGKVKDSIIKILAENGYISPLKREDFEKGELGNNAYELIKSGIPCKINGCEKLSKRTIDSSVPKKIHNFAVCSDEHASELKHQIKEWAEDEGLSIRFGKNGVFTEKQSPKNEVIFKA